MCGILGISNQSDDVFAEIYDGLLMLQHRGQDASGMVTYNGEFFRERKANGLVKDVFGASDAEVLTGHVGIGHVRYPTAGSLSAAEAQPFFVNAPYGIYLVHNGNITNTAEQGQKVTAKYSRHLRTTSDSEILLNVLADKIFDSIKVNGTADPVRNIFAGVRMTMERVQGAYSVITMIAGVGLMAFRDPRMAFVPCRSAKRVNANGKEEYCFASEDVAFGINGFEKIRDVKPGEAILVDHGWQDAHAAMRRWQADALYL